MMVHSARSAPARSSFVHLHVHSLYSPMRGVPSVEALCAAARAQGADTLALTDTNGLYGVPSFLAAAREAGLCPIVGAEVTHGRRRVVALVKTAKGYENLCRLVSDRHSNPEFDLVTAVANRRDGLILISDDAEAVSAWRLDSAQDLYLEVTPGLPSYRTLELNRAAGIPLLATNRVHLLNPGEFPLHRLLRAIALRTTLSGVPNEECCSPGTCLAEPVEFERRVAHLPGAAANTRAVADACIGDRELRRAFSCAFPEVPNGDPDRMLQQKAFAGAGHRYGTLTPAVRARLERELDLIRRRRLSSFFLIVEQIARRASRTCGRGSAAASIVAYCLGITHVDPISHHLMFDRFLNAARREPPDIDIDVPWDERDELLDWAISAYGPHRAAMVATHNTLGLQGGFREVARVYGMAPAEIDRVAPIVARYAALLELEESRGARSLVRRLSRELRLVPPWANILELAARIAGAFRYIAVHCGGLVIGPEDLRRSVPVETARKGVPVVQWDKQGVEEAGLLKIDLLGNRSLAVVRDTLASVGRQTGRRQDTPPWDPDHDAEAQALVRRGDTMGCFHIESPATRLMLQKLWMRMPPERLKKCDFFEYLTMISALVRPAAISFMPAFVRRAHGVPHEPPDPTVARILHETHGIMVYQEDVTRVAMSLAGFSPDEADELRRAVSKKARYRELRDFCARFARGAAARNVAPEAIASMWTMILSFTGYSYCKPHACSYAQLAIQSAYLRAHHPAEFMAAVLSNGGGYYSASAYLSEARRMGLKILPPDINKSDWHYTGVARSIRVGLMQIKGISRRLVDQVASERARAGPFNSLEDFLHRVRGEPEQCRRLIKAGVFDEIGGGLSRPGLLWRLHGWRAACDNPALPSPPQYPPEANLQHEVESFGFPISRHPLELYAERVREIPHIEARDMQPWTGKRVRMIGWAITEKLTHTREGEPMGFMTFEDGTGLYEATFFPETYRRYGLLLGQNGAYVLDGVVEEDLGALSLTVRSIRILDARAPAPFGPARVGGEVYA
jgi:error-prone DNA polymerase